MKKIFTLFILLMVLPVTVLAAVDAPQTLYVAGQAIIDEGYYTQSEGSWTKSSDTSIPPSEPYFHYTKGSDNTPATLTLSGATIQGGTSTGSVPYGAGIYAQCSNGQSVTLTIKLIGENTITGYYGIYVNAEISADSNGTDASLTITGENNGSLEVSGSNHGIFVKSGTGNASLNIEKATVTSSTNGGYAAGVYVQSGVKATGSPNISLSVNGGSLTASGTGNSDGILFYVGQSQATGATTSLTVTDHAIVDARNGGISASRISETLPTPTPTGNNSSGIVFDDKNGTVYGDVTLDESFTINEGETLTVPDGSSLKCNGNLTNNGKIINYGTINGTVTGNGTVAIPLTADMIKLQEEKFIYIGNAIEPKVTVSNDGVTYTDTDYTVSYSDNINAGTAKVTVTPKEGSLLLGDAVTKEFTIAKATPKITLNVPSGEALVYDGKAKEVTATVKGVDNETVDLTASVAYYSDDTYQTKVEEVKNAGTYYVKATFVETDNYKEAESKANFTIAKAKAPEDGNIGPAEGTDKEIHIYSDQSTFSLSVVANMESVGKWVWEVTEGTDVAEITSVEAQQLKAAGNESEGNKSKATFKVLGTGTAKITATYMNNNYKDYKVEFSVSVSTPPVVVTYHDLHITESVGAKLVSRYDKTSTPDGGSFTLSLEKEEGYEDCEPTVYYKRGRFGEWKELKLDEVSGYYQIRSVYTDIYVKVSGDGIWPVSNEKVEAQEVKVYTQNGAIIVSTPSLMDVQIISMTGSVVAADKVAGQREFRNIAEGIYVVRVGEEIVKVRL